MATFLWGLLECRYPCLPVLSPAQKHFTDFEFEAFNEGITLNILKPYALFPGIPIVLPERKIDKPREREQTERFSLTGKKEGMSKSCKGLTYELVKCLSESYFVKVENRSFRECAKEKSPTISSECVGLRETYFNCKRGQVDMRARIRGNKGY